MVYLWRLGTSIALAVVVRLPAQKKLYSRNAKEIFFKEPWFLLRVITIKFVQWSI